MADKKTIENLKAAFAGESQANRKYTYFAEKADAEGFTQVAKLFRAAAYAEAIHARNHLRALAAIQGTAENLQTAIDGEEHEVADMYPGFIDEARLEEEKRAARSFQWAMEVEIVHAGLYRQALAGLGGEVVEGDYYVCPVCGYTHFGPMTEACPVCGNPAERFEKMS
jgi:rubrerythrin